MAEAHRDSSLILIDKANEDMGCAQTYLREREIDREHTQNTLEIYSEEYFIYSNNNSKSGKVQSTCHAFTLG